MHHKAGSLCDTGLIELKQLDQLNWRRCKQFTLEIVAEVAEIAFALVYAQLHRYLTPPACPPRRGGRQDDGAPPVGVVSCLCVP